MKITTETEQEIMDRFRQGDQTAFRAVFERFYQELCYFSFRLINNREQGEEIVSECMTKLFDRHQNFESLANIKSFLYIVTRNLSMNFLVSKDYKNTQKRTAIESAEMQSDENLQANILRIDILKKVREEVESLPEQQKLVFKLFYFHELSIDEISEKVNISPATVRGHKFLAVQKLRVLFSRSGLISIAMLVAIMTLY